MNGRRIMSVGISSVKECRKLKPQVESMKQRCCGMTRRGVPGRLQRGFVLLAWCMCSFGAWPCAALPPVSPNLRTKDSAAQQRRLSLPVPPNDLELDEQLRYIVEHYWDTFDFEDTTWLADTTCFEQAFADWAYLASFLPAEQVCKSTGYVVERADVSHAMLMRFALIAERYFTGAASPYRNEEAMIPILQQLTRAQNLEPAERARFGALLEQADRNRPGTQAAELRGMTADGRRIALSSLEGEYTLLLFYTPSCPTCASVERQIRSSTTITELLKQGKLSVYALYPGPGDEAWRQDVAEMEAPGWYVVCDPDGAVANLECYVISSTPSLYLLGGGRRVILKEPAFEQLESWLNEYAANCTSAQTSNL